MARRRGRFRRSRGRSKSGGSDFSAMKGVSAAVYGGVRGKISEFIRPYTSKATFLGQYSAVADEIAIAAALYFFGNKLPSGFVRDMGKAAYNIETARIGQFASNQLLTTNGSSSAPLEW